MIIDPKFNGPPDSAHGGYTCGLAAALVDAPAVAVRLDVPPPLGVDLPVEIDADGSVTVRHEDAVVATARAAEPLGDLAPPVAPDIGEAREAMRSHRSIGMFSRCFVCGRDRPDGLGLHFGPLPGRPDVNAAVLQAGDVPPELVWAALDCPSYVPSLIGAERIALLGGLHAELLAPVPPGVPVVCVGWEERADGRKHHTASAIVDTEGELLARARAVWIEVRQ